MWPYWLMFLIPAFAALSRRKQGSELNWAPWVLVGTLFILFIGYRYQVGGDWVAYLYYYEDVINSSFIYAITQEDPGYVLLNWAMTRMDLGIFGVNVVCGALFISGLVVFSRTQPKPWLAFCIAVPYIVIVIAMGYTRQGVALGFIFWALVYLEKGKFLRYVLFIALATTFHRTAIIMIPLGMFLYQKGWYFRVVATGIIGFGLWDAFVYEDYEQLWTNYVEYEMHSQGAKIRVLMNLVPALFLLLYWKRWKKTYPNALFWLWMSLGAIACVILVDFATTAVDRIALYLTPLQVVVFSRLPYLANKLISPGTMTLGLVLGYALVLFVWLNYAVHSIYWLPYKNALFL